MERFFLVPEEMDIVSAVLTFTKYKEIPISLRSGTKKKSFKYY